MAAKSDALAAIAAELMGGRKGLIAMDESSGTCAERFRKAGIPQTEEMRRDYRELILRTPGLGRYVGGAILFDETLRQQAADGTPLVRLAQAAGIVPGIKVDQGAHPLPGFPGEKLTEGLDGLADRLKEYFALGARFAKWRAVIAIGPGLPSDACVGTNAQALALYAARCQEAGLVPIVEPEVLMDGDHPLAACAEATRRAQQALFAALAVLRVDLTGLILKPNMVLAGKRCRRQPGDDEVADATVRCLLETVPAAVGGVAFLSGGQTGPQAASRLNAMHVRWKDRLPWPLTYSFSRAIQYPALEIWAGRAAHARAAQRALAHRARCAWEARSGRYRPSSERVKAR